MNSEELELSLRAEFEHYLKDAFGSLREDVSSFQKNFEAEFEKQKTQMLEAISELHSRIDATTQFDKAFTESVVEHLRLARDEGARITEAALTEAAKLDGGMPVVVAEPVVHVTAAAGWDKLRDAINDISAQSSQSAILKSLVEQASEYTARGAFFIVRSDRFVSWKLFGRDVNGEDKVPEINFPVAAKTVLGDAVSGNSTTEAAYGQFAEDSLFLEPLEYGQPANMFAVPLVVRGKGVAVLYVDRSTGEEDLNVEAIETLVRVAGLTVELLAASQSARVQPVAAAPAPEPAPAAPAEPVATEAVEPTPAAPVVETTSVHDRDAYKFVSDSKPAEFESHSAAPPAEAPSEPAVETVSSNGSAYQPTPQAPPVAEAPRPRPGRNIDLPIEVAESERKEHNNARRFARLLVSEIKLYNSEQVEQAREAGELYPRLREAIDRSREMYDNRVTPEVASKFDYFHHELVNDLAQGNAAKLGNGYPGAAV